jgi:hypothetical protein
MRNKGAFVLLMPSILIDSRYSTAGRYVGLGGGITQWLSADVQLRAPFDRPHGLRGVRFCASHGLVATLRIGVAHARSHEFAPLGRWSSSISKQAWSVVLRKEGNKVA